MDFYRQDRFQWSYRQTSIRQQSQNSSFEWVHSTNILGFLDAESKPKGNKLLSIVELWTHSKQSNKPLNEWLTSVYNLVEVCDYPEDSKDRTIRDVLIIGCSSDKAKDKIVWQGEAVTLNQVIEIL